MTPRRIVKTPTFKLASTLPSPMENKPTPAITIAPGTYNVEQDRSVSRGQSLCSVRQNLMNALDRDGTSNALPSGSTKFEFKVPSSMISSKLMSTSSKLETSSNVQNDSSFLQQVKLFQSV
jgi:hypothetical protein